MQDVFNYTQCAKKNENFCTFRLLKFLGIYKNQKDSQEYFPFGMGCSKIYNIIYSMGNSLNAVV